MQGDDDAARVMRSFLQCKHPVPRKTVALCQHFNHKPPELPSPSSAESLVAKNCNREFPQTYLPERRQLTDCRQHYISQGCTNFPKIQEPAHNSRRPKVDMKQISHWRPTNVRRRCTKFSRPGDLGPCMCTPLMALFHFETRFLHRVIRMFTKLQNLLFVPSQFEFARLGPVCSDICSTQNLSGDSESDSSSNGIIFLNK